jgi:hypothetical protein
LSIYKYLSTHPSEFSEIREKERVVFEEIPFDMYRRFFTRESPILVSFGTIRASLLRQEAIPDVLAFLKRLRDAFAEVMDKSVEQRVLSTSRDVLYLAGTYHIEQLKKRLLQNEFVQTERFYTFPNKDCVFIAT